MSTATQPIVTQETPEVDKDTGKFVYTYQPRDSDGQFIGKPYRFLYSDHQDLIRQITEAKEHGDRYIHEVKTGKRQVHGEPASPAPSYQPAPESTEETEKARREEFRKTAEQEFGAPVDQVRADMKRARELEEYLICNTWTLNKNEYYACKENAAAIGKWLKEQTPPLKVTAANLDLAFEELKDKLVPKPQEQAAPPADSTQQQTSTRTEVRPQSTGIIPGQFEGTRPGTRTEKQPLTRERFRQIDLMSNGQFMRLQKDNPKEYWAFIAMKHPAQPQQ